MNPAEEFIVATWEALPAARKRRIALDAIRTAAEKAAAPYVRATLSEIVPMEVRSAVTAALREGFHDPTEIRRMSVGQIIGRTIASAVEEEVRRHHVTIGLKIEEAR